MENLDQDEIKEAYNAARISESIFKGHIDFLVEQQNIGKVFNGNEVIKGIIGFAAVSLAKIMLQVEPGSEKDINDSIDNFCDQLKRSIRKALTLENTFNKNELRIH